MLRSEDGRIACGCRFKHITPIIDFNYESLTKALTDAIDAEAKASNGKFVTEEREVASTLVAYDYDALRAEFDSIVNDLMAKDRAKYAPYIMETVERYLGKGKKLSDTTRSQAELVYLVVQELKDEVVNK